MTIAISVTSAASQPASLFWTPSSRSIISSARASASWLTSAAGWCSRVTSSLIANEQAPSGGAFSLVALRLVDFHALLFEVAQRAGVPGNAAGRGGLLVLELEV